MLKNITEAAMGYIAPNVVDQLHTAAGNVRENQYKNYDYHVQEVLDQYWPGTTDMESLKRGERMVYRARFNETDVVVKSTTYSEELESNWDLYASFVNFISSSINVAYYIEPEIEHSDDKKKLVSVSAFADGDCPECQFGYQLSWITYEPIAREIGETMAKFRLASQNYEREHPEQYSEFPSWDTIQGGWQTQFRGITIPATPENFGLIHSDMHTGNFMFKQNSMRDFDMTIIDFDNSQRSWYMIDLGTIVFQAQLEMIAHVPTYLSMDMFNAYIDQFKYWVTDEYANVYGSPVDRDELTQGCQWRQDFLYGVFLTFRNNPAHPDHETAEWYCNYYETGNMPSC